MACERSLWSFGACLWNLPCLCDEGLAQGQMLLQSVFIVWGYFFFQSFSENVFRIRGGGRGSEIYLDSSTLLPSKKTFSFLGIWMTSELLEESQLLYCCFAAAWARLLTSACENTAGNIPPPVARQLQLGGNSLAPRIRKVSVCLNIWCQYPRLIFPSILLHLKTQDNSAKLTV